MSSALSTLLSRASMDHAAQAAAGAGLGDLLAGHAADSGPVRQDRAGRRRPRRPAGRAGSADPREILDLITHLGGVMVLLIALALILGSVLQ
ncbi:hypothetical protein ACRAWD_08175, partial [Caulobacter segnis]